MNSSLSQRVGRFVAEHKNTFVVTDLDKEQDIQNLKIYGDYKALIEKQLEEWLEKEKLAHSDFLAMFKDTSSLMSLTGALDYKTLHALMEASQEGNDEIRLTDLISAEEEDGEDGEEETDPF
eukprot:TRINITY_DN66473_c8_g5_i1.p1 TRINITY_DN66473_c8_g5~~TRINITY_DN66473_c8_g5_i1.p1  ORF type:complete len:122 (-),score=22.02 TRINITY_DN66473_c8_g5_i1:134-499(-)